MKNTQQILDELKKLTIESNKYANTPEINWIVKNAELLEETIKGEPLLYPESVTEFPFALGGLVYALKELDDATRKRLADVYIFYATTGFRKKEPFFVGIGENMAIVKDTKGDAGRGRKVGLDSYQMETLKKLKRRTHTSTIKGERNTNSHELDYWSRQFNFVLRDMGIKKGRKFHNLRDTYITKTWLLTGDIFLTSNIVGHTSIAVTQNYSSFLLEEIGHHFPSVVALRNERQAIADAQKQFNLNPWIPQG